MARQRTQSVAPRGLADSSKGLRRDLLLGVFFAAIAALYFPISVKDAENEKKAAGVTLYPNLTR